MEYGDKVMIHQRAIAIRIHIQRGVEVGVKVCLALLAAATTTTPVTHPSHARSLQLFAN